MTIYLPNPLLHETGAEIEEFIDAMVPDPPPPPAPSRALARRSPTDPDASASGSRETISSRSPP
jgi:hypothetical protein